MIAAIESDDPVIFMEPKRIYRAIKQEVADEEFSIPIGKAKVLTEEPMSRLLLSEPWYVNARKLSQWQKNPEFPQSLLICAQFIP